MSKFQIGDIITLRENLSPSRYYLVEATDPRYKIYYLYEDYNLSIEHSKYFIETWFDLITTIFREENK